MEEGIDTLVLGCTHYPSLRTFSSSSPDVDGRGGGNAKTCTVTSCPEAPGPAGGRHGMSSSRRRYDVPASASCPRFRVAIRSATGKVEARGVRSGRARHVAGAGGEPRDLVTQEGYNLKSMRPTAFARLRRCGVDDSGRPSPGHPITYIRATIPTLHPPTTRDGGPGFLLVPGGFTDSGAPFGERAT